MAIAAAWNISSVQRNMRIMFRRVRKPTIPIANMMALARSTTCRVPCPSGSGPRRGARRWCSRGTSREIGVLFLEEGAEAGREASLVLAEVDLAAGEDDRSEHRHEQDHARDLEA